MKEKYKAGDYVVIESYKNVTHKSDQFLENYCYKIRNADSDEWGFRPVLDCKGSATNGYKTTYINTRYATSEEIAEYDRLGKPYDVTTLKPQLVGRYLKALVDRPNKGRIKAGEIGIITEVYDDNPLIPQYVNFPSQHGYGIGEITYKNGGYYELMPEGFTLENIFVPDNLYDVGDIIDTNTEGYQYSDINCYYNESWCNWNHIKKTNCKTIKDKNTTILDKVFSTVTNSWWYKTDKYGSNWISECGIIGNSKKSESSNLWIPAIGELVYVQSDNYIDNNTKYRTGAIVKVIKYADNKIPETNEDWIFLEGDFSNAIRLKLLRKYESKTEPVVKSYTAEEALKEIQKLNLQIGDKYYYRYDNGTLDKDDIETVEYLPEIKYNSYIDCGSGYLWYIDYPDLIADESIIVERVNKTELNKEELLAEAKRRYPVGTAFYPSHIDRNERFCIITSDSQFIEDEKGIYSKITTENSGIYEKWVSEEFSKYGNCAYDRYVYIKKTNKWAEIVSLPESKPTFDLSNTKIKVNSEEESKLVQEKAFELGWEWTILGKQVSYCSQPYLYFYAGEIITNGDNKIYFDNHTNKEITLSDLGLKSDEFVLPEKWCFKVTKENYQEFKHKRELLGFDGYILSIPYNGNSWGLWAESIPSGYTEITFEQFKKYVLKEESEVYTHSLEPEESTDTMEFKMVFGSPGQGKSYSMGVDPAIDYEVKQKVKHPLYRERKVKVKLK